MRNFSLAVLLSFLTLASAQSALNAVVTIGMIADVVDNVAGECAEVTTIMGAGVDPHLYQASSRDVRTFSDADIIFYSGYSLEGQLGDVLERLSRRTATVAVSQSAITPASLIASDGIYGIDPHLWMDVSLWAKTPAVIAEELAILHPDCEEALLERAENYSETMLALHDWITEAVATIPEDQRILVTAHDAFAYYGRAYGIEVAGIQGISTESEAGIADIRAMAEVIAERSVPAVFIETTINPRTIQAVIDAVAQRGHEVSIGGELFSDAMGEEGTYGGTYLGMLFSNTATIVSALGGELPALPEALQEWADGWDIDLSAF